MKNVTFNIAASRFRCFTAAQETKVKEGLAIFQKVANDARFQDAVTNFMWTSENSTAYNRFLLSKGMSNTQVRDSICNKTTVRSMNDTTTITGQGTMACNVIPCCNRNEYVYCSTNSTAPTICINSSLLSQEWYTPVHVAAAIMHEWCINKGFSCTTNGTLVTDYTSTVPYACGRTVLTTAKTVCSNDAAVTKSIEQINPATFDYCPCSTSWGTERTQTECLNVCEQVDQVVAVCEVELDCITRITKKTQDEVNRMTVLTNCVTNLNEIKTRLLATSLDGTETVMVPHTERRRVAVGL